MEAKLSKERKVRVHIAWCSLFVLNPTSRVDLKGVRTSAFCTGSSYTGALFLNQTLTQPESREACRERTLHLLTPYFLALRVVLVSSPPILIIGCQNWDVGGGF